jgi:DNA-binding MarR family transcriptional regulator
MAQASFSETVWYYVSRSGTRGWTRKRNKRIFSLDIGTHQYYTCRYTVNSNIVTDPQILILASLADGEKHGYAMMEDIERFSGILLGAGTLYGAVTRLEDRGWIRRVESEDRRKPYRITGAGVSYLEEQMAGLERVVKTAQRRLKHA